MQAKLEPELGPGTFFAPAERASEEDLQRTVQRVASHPLFRVTLDAFNGLVLVLNRQRQIVAVNDWFLRKQGLGSAEKVLGLRPGDAIGCANANQAPSGCGTDRACAYCGAVQAFITSREKGTAVHGECLIRISRGENFAAVEFEVSATPLTLEGEELTVIALRDISDQKRREYLESTFFHDLLNTIGGLQGWSDILLEVAEGKSRDIAETIFKLATRLVDDVEYQRALVQAEKGSLRPLFEELSLSEIVEELRTIFLEHRGAKSRRLLMDEVDPEVRITTDRVLLVRVLINMLKNAFEATPRGGEVRFWWENSEGAFRFNVWSAAVMPEEVAQRIFQRSFSTKGESGRGLGTYSMKLFGENHLGGKVSFTSREGEGTVFTIALPAAPRRSKTPSTEIAG